MNDLRKNDTMKKYLKKAMRSTGIIVTLFMVGVLSGQENKKVGVGTKAPKNAEVLFDGSRETSY